MAKHPVDTSAILLALAGVATSGLVDPLGNAIDNLYPGHGKPIVAFISALSYGAAIIVRVIYNRTPETNVASLPPAPAPNPDPAPTASTPPTGEFHGP